MVPFDPSHYPERRRRPRRHAPVKVLMRRADIPLDPPDKAEIEDMTSEGFRLRSAEPVQVGEPLVLFVSNIPKPLNARVVWAHVGTRVPSPLGRAVDQGWTAGCQVDWESRFVATGLEKRLPRPNPWTKLMMGAARSFGKILLAMGLLALLALTYLTLATLLAGGQLTWLERFRFPK